MSKHKKNNAARKRQLKRHRHEITRKTKRAEKRHDSRNSNTKRIRAIAARTEKVRRQNAAHENRIRHQVEGAPMKALKKMAKAAGLTGYSGWVAKDRSHAEASIIEAMMSGSA